MKKYLFLLLVILLAQAANAQDVIIKINGDEMNARVREITPTQIIYLSADTTDTLSYKIAKSEVFMLRFANGTKEVFHENLPPVAVTANPKDMYLKGRQDARKYYDGQGVMWGSAAAMFMGGPIGPVIIGAIRPRANNNPALAYTALQDKNYVKGYEKQAHNQKIGKAAIGAGIGTAAMFLLVIGMVASMP